jgi:WD40 repeat protein
MVTAITPDGRTLAAGAGNGAVGFADPRAGRLLGPPQLAHVGPVLALAFSDDGKWLASSGEDRAVYLWDVRRRKPVRLYVGLTHPATSLSVSPNGTELAATGVQSGGTGELDILSIPRLALLAQRATTPGIKSQFSRDGRHLFYGDYAGQVWTFDTRTWKPVGAPLTGQARPGSFALSPDERMLATTSSDGTTQLWDIPSRRPIGTALRGAANHPVSAAFVDRGNHLVTLHDNGRGYLWDIRPRYWARRACEIAGRTLTRAEWHNTLPRRDYAPACAHP